MFGHKDKKSFFERITGSISISNQDEATIDEPISRSVISNDDDWVDNGISEEVGELAIDVYEKPNEIVVQAMIAGVKPENIDIDITRQSITIRGFQFQFVTKCHDLTFLFY